MAIAQDLNTLKTKEQGLTQNKVSRFAYTQNAYDNDTVTGVSDYVPSRGMNVPLGTAEIMKVNPTIPDKGWRAQASALTRMLMNHFLGRISYNLNKAHDNFLSFLTSLQGSLGTANGIATLDANGRIPYSQLPESAIEYKGTWNADTNSPTLADGTGTLGDMYIVSVAGTQNLGSGAISFEVGDRVLYDGSVWQKLSSGGGDVASVNNVLPDPVTKNVEVKADDISTNLIEVPDITVVSNLGKVWTQSNKTDNSFFTVYFADGIWVAGSNAGLWWSSDGKTWTQSNKTDNSFFTVYFADGIWVAGSNAGLWWSSDGKTWTQSNKPYLISSTVYFADGIWVAGSRDAGLWWSSDGKTWTQSNKTDNSFFTVYFADGIWVAGSNAGLWWSSDGKTWTQSNKTDGYFNYHSVYFADGIWVAGSNSSTGLWWSSDGKTWTQSNKTNKSFYTVYFADGIWVAGSYSGTGLWWSSDGKTWTQSNKTDGYFNYHSVYFADGIWVAGSNSSTGLWWSSDGKTWTQSNKTNKSFYTVYFADGIWVAGSYSGTGLWYSAIEMTKNVEKILTYLLSKVG